MQKASDLGVKLIYSKVRDSNEKSRMNLKKAGFRFAGRYISRVDKATRLDWYTKSLQPLPRKQQKRIMREILSDSVAVLY
jgi:hypothetical protein